ncbi:hypothetical protein GLYMA_01G044650v4 [Glycine max]|nr:hypothetical protein GLYMA_01G044650v4 [Glycine max]KAH1161589.1 hypothetical protein GYH30_000466 [Glycine max]
MFLTSLLSPVSLRMLKLSDMVDSAILTSSGPKL